MPSNRSWYSRLWYLQHFNLFQEFTEKNCCPSPGWPDLVGSHTACVK